MGVLNIIDGIFVRLLLGQFQIEIEVAVGTSHQEVVARRISPHLIDHLAKGDELPRAGGHRRRFAIPEEVDELHQDYLQGLLLMPKRLHGGGHPGDVPMMISAPDVDHGLKTSQELVPVVGDVGCKIGRIPVLPDDNPVFFVPEGCGPEPEGPSFPIDETLLFQIQEELFDAFVPIEFPFAEVEVENDTEGPQILFDSFQNCARSIIGETRNDLGRVPDQVFFPVPFEQFRSQVADVIAFVASFGKFRRLTQQFTIAEQNGFPQIVHLVSRIVDVIFPGNLIADGRKNVRDDVTHDGPARMTDMKRPRGVGADKFHLDPLAFSQIRRSVPIPLPPDGLEERGQSTLPNKKVQKAGTGDLHLRQHPFAIVDPFRQNLRDLTGILFRLGGENHRNVGGVIAVAGISRQLHFDPGGRNRRQKAFVDGRLNRFFEKLYQYLFHTEPFTKGNHTGLAIPVRFFSRIYILLLDGEVTRIIDTTDGARCIGRNAVALLATFTPCTDRAILLLRPHDPYTPLVGAGLKPALLFTILTANGETLRQGLPIGNDTLPQGVPRSQEN